MFTRTKIYSVFVKKDSRNPLDTAIFIKQGFNFWAFILTPIWALYNRLWFAFILLAVFSGLLAINEGPQFAIASLILDIWFGFEANNFKSRKLENRGYITFDIITGIDRLAAQTRFYDKYLLTKSTGKQANLGLIG